MATGVWRVLARIGVLAASLGCLAVAPLPAASADARLDDTPRLLVLSAFGPEWRALVGSVQSPKSYTVHGMTFVSGTLSGKPVVLALSGVSMVNAAMNTQMLLDRFHVTGIVFSGIAGGVDPGLKIGDVVAPEAWGQSLESIFARETAEGYKPEHLNERPDLPNFGMMFPNGVQVGNADTPPAYRFWFPVDPHFLAVAQKVAAATPLRHCVTPDRCLDHPPQVIVGGHGVSGPAFVDNKPYREYVFRAFHAQVIDMESAAVAQVAFANQTPFIAFRSLSDLAGGDEKANQMSTFMSLASENSASVVIAFIKALP